MSVLGNLIVVLITAVATYLAVTQMGLGGSSGPVTLSPEIERYIDGKLAGSTSGAMQDLQKISARVNEMETKLTDIERLRASYDQLSSKSQLVESAIAEQRKRRDDAMMSARQAELTKLRNEIATVCAGVTIKRVESAAGGGTNPEAARFRENIGAVGNRPGPGGAQNQPWNQRNRRPGGPGRGRGGGGPAQAPQPPGGAQGGQGQ